MFSQIVVPLDGSGVAARALKPGAVLARELDSPLRVVGYAAPDYVGDLQRQVTAAVDDAELTGVTVEIDVSSVDGRTVPECLAEVIDTTPGSLVCMSSTGRGRTGAIFGSVAEGVLRARFGPVLLLGPSCDVDGFGLGGRLVVPLDGSDTSESILPIAAAWTIVFHYEPELVAVASPTAPRAMATAARGGADAGSESSYVHRMAEQLAAETGKSVDFDVLHDDDAVGGIVDHLTSSRGSLVALSTHGATGLARLVAGSVAMGVVHRAPCPVLVHRPPHLPD